MAQKGVVIKLDSHTQQVVKDFLSMKIELSINYQTYRKSHRGGVQGAIGGVERFEDVFTIFVENCVDQMNIMAIEVMENAYSKYGFSPKHPLTQKIYDEFYPSNKEEGMIKTGASIAGLHQLLKQKRGPVTWTTDDYSKDSKGRTVIKNVMAVADRFATAQSKADVEPDNPKTGFQGYMRMAGNGYFTFSGYPFERDRGNKLSTMVYGLLLLRYHDWIPEAWKKALNKQHMDRPVNATKQELKSRAAKLEKKRKKKAKKGYKELPTLLESAIRSDFEKHKSIIKGISGIRKSDKDKSSTRISKLQQKYGKAEEYESKLGGGSFGDTSLNKRHIEQLKKGKKSNVVEETQEQYEKRKHKESL